MPLSAASVSRLVRALDAQVAAFHRRPITFPARYLLVDGLWVSVRGAAGGPSDGSSWPPTASTSTAAGSCSTTVRRPAESAAEWGRLLRSLVERGLDPDAVVLVTADGAGGIAAAVAEAFPDAALQRCWTHRLRNLLEALPLAERTALPARAARHLPGPHPAGRGGRLLALGAWPGGPATRSSCAASRRDLDELLAVFALPEPLRASLRTTNLLERAFRELRRRLRPIGCLADRRSADRILYGQVVRLNERLAARPLAAFTQET